MKTSLLTSLTLAASLVTSLSADAQSFAPNHLWVGGDNGKLLEFNTARQHVRTLSLPADTRFTGLAFGPDGNLYAADTNNGRLYQVQPSGQFAVVYESGATYEQIVFQENGGLSIATLGGTLISLSLETRTATFSIRRGTSDLRGLAIGPQGHDYWAHGAAVSQMGPDGRMGSDLWEHSHIATKGPMAFAPNGNLLVCDYSADGKVVELGYYGQKTNSYEDPALGGGASGVAVGPNGHIFVSAHNQASLVEFAVNGTRVRTLRHPDLSRPGMIAFAPFRFKTKIQGQVSGADMALAKSKDSKAILSIAPGSRTVMIQLADNPASQTDLASRLGGATMVIRGYEAVQSGAARKRLFSGASLETHTLMNGGSGLTLSLNGKVDQDGNYVIKKAKGNLSHRDTTRCYMGSVKSGKLVR